MNRNPLIQPSPSSPSSPSSMAPSDIPIPTSTTTTTTSFLDTLTSNPYFSAGFGLLGLGTGLRLLQKGLLHGTNLAYRRLLIKLEIPSKDKSYHWFLNWISTRPTTPTSSAFTRPFSHQVSVETSYKRHENGHVETSLSLVPGPGKHYFKYKNAWFQIERSREKQMIDLTSGTPWETIQITTLRRDQGLLQEMLSEAQSLAIKKEEGKTVLFTAWGPEWRPFGLPRRRRPLDSVVLDQGVAESIVQDVEKFILNGNWYNKRGIPYRRGYLLYGPPGSGKSSFIQALAGELEYNICILNLSETGLTDDRLNHLLSIAPPRSILLLEDIDAAFVNRSQSDQKGFQRSSVTFSGLLNALDGVASAEERMVFMTTNHIERLDPALIRPGRVDMKVLLDNVSEYQLRKMFGRFYGESDAEGLLGEAFVKKAVEVGALEKGVSAASLQGHFVRFMNDPKGAVDNAEYLLT